MTNLRKMNNITKMNNTKRLIVFLISIILALSVLATVMADDDNNSDDNNSSNRERNDYDDDDDRENNSKDNHGQKVKEINREAREDSKQLREEYREKISELDKSKKFEMKELRKESHEKLKDIRMDAVTKILALNHLNIENFSFNYTQSLGKLDARYVNKLAKLEEKNLRKVSKLEEKYLSKLAKLSQEKIKRLAKLEVQRLKDYLDTVYVKKVKLIDMFKKRNLTDQQKNASAQEYLFAKEKFEQALADQTLAKKLFEQLSKQQKECAKLNFTVNTTANNTSANVSTNVTANNTDVTTNTTTDTNLTNNTGTNNTIDNTTAENNTTLGNNTTITNETNATTNTTIENNTTIVNETNTTAANATVNTTLNATYCAGLDNKVFAQAKLYAELTAEVAIWNLKMLKAKIDGTTTLTQEQANKLVKQLDEAILKITALADSLENSSTKQEVKLIAKEIQRTWILNRQLVEGSVLVLIHGKHGEIIQRSTHLEAKLQQTLAEMKLKGIEVEGIETKVSAFSAKIAEAAEHYRLANELLVAAKLYPQKAYVNLDFEITGSDPQGDEETTLSTLPLNDKIKPRLVQAARKHLKLANQALNDAHAILKEIVKAFKEAGHEIKQDDEDEVEVIVDDEDPSTELGDGHETTYLKETVEIVIIDDGNLRKKTVIRTKTSLSLSPEIQNAIAEIAQSFTNDTTKITVELKAEKEDALVVVQPEVEKSSLTAEQTVLWQPLQDKVKAFMEASQATKAKIEIEIEHELDD